MDVSQLLQEIENELDIKTDDILINTEIQMIRKQIKESIMNINDIKSDRETFKRDKKIQRLTFKIMMPYILYVSMFMRDIAIENNLEINKDFITVVLQKHLEHINNNNE